MNTIIIPALTVALPSIGFIAGALFAGGGIREYRELLEASFARERGLHAQLEELDEVDNTLRAHIRKLQGQVELLINRNREYALAESKRQEQRIAAAAKGRETQATNRTEARHLRMEAAEQRSAMKQAAE